MASNSSKPNSPKNTKNIGSESDANEPHKEKLTDDLDFWSMDTDTEAVEAADMELDEVAEFCESRPSVAAVLVVDDSKIKSRCRLVRFNLDDSALRVLD